MQLVEQPTKYMFFTGKGGVGKTSTACAVAIGLADRGKRVLLVSTDPASNLDEVLGTKLSTQPVRVESAGELYALNIDPEQAAEDYRQRVVAPYRGVIPDDEVARIQEQLSGACTVEVAAFDEFTGFLTRGESSDNFDHIIFDTAPTGHTLRLLQLPAAWADFMEVNDRGASCLGPASALKTQKERYAETVQTLSDNTKTTLVLVIRPERSAILEAERTLHELDSLGLGNQHLVVNGIFHAADRNDRFARALEDKGISALSSLPVRLERLPRTEVSLKGHNLVGLQSLRRFFEDEASDPGLGGVDLEPLPKLPTLSELTKDIAAEGHGLIMLMGKGGVGKTTVAASIALELVKSGHRVHLTTTDPAAHLSNVLPENVEGLKVSRIDPVQETLAYTERIVQQRGKNMDAEGIALLREDLRSPCTEEVAVFHAFSRIVASARREIVVMDTAPTGHTLLLLDATGAYHREVLRGSGQGGVNLVTPLMRLQDPAYTKVLIVTLAETTPVSEAAQLQKDLGRAGIKPFGWVINSSLAAARPQDPLLVERAKAELPLIRKVTEDLADLIAVMPLLVEEPTKSDGLELLAKSNAAGAPSD